MKPRALWITDEAPNRGLGGGNIRQSHLVEGLAERFDVDLLLAGDGGQPDDHVASVVNQIVGVPLAPRPSLSKNQVRVRSLVGALTPLGPQERQEGAASCKALRRAVKMRPDAYDVYVVNHFGLAPLLSDLGTQRTCLETQRIPSRDSAQQVALATGARQRWLQQRDVAGARRLERWAVTHSDRVVTVSDEDAEALNADCWVAPNGVDVQRWRRLRASRVQQAKVVFTGTLNYAPNVDGLLWFCQEIWPVVRQSLPQASFHIVGRNPVADVLRLAEIPGVDVTPNVPDTAPFLAAARVAVVPLRFGSGTRLKVLETLAAGKTLIGTTVGLEGLGIVDGVHALVADDVNSFARKVIEALETGWNPSDMVERGAELAGRFSWQEIASHHAHQLASWVGRDRSC